MQQTTTPLHDDIDESAQRRAFSRAVEVLSSSLDFGLTLEHTIAVCLPALGDDGFFDVVHGDEVRRTARRRQRRRRADACAAACGWWRSPAMAASTTAPRRWPRGSTSTS